MSNERRTIGGPNPLVRYLVDYSDPQEISDALRWNPLQAVNVRELSFLKREEYLVGDKDPLTPTVDCLKAAITIRSMVLHSLRLRDPATAAGRMLRADLMDAALSGQDFLKVAPAPGACILVVDGITGVAKTVTVKHAGRILGPQAIRHGREDAASWVTASQLNYIIAAMSHDGSRGGFITNILLPIDRVLGTDHAVSLPRKHRTIEKLCGALIALLHSLYVGFLGIDEIQLLNLVESEHPELMQMLLLSIMNSGIPIGLIGNPLGFTWLDTYAQIISRVVERSPIRLHPAGAIPGVEDEWETISSGVRSFYVLPDPPLREEECSDRLKARSGGNQKFALTLWCNAQRDAQYRGRSCINPGDIDRAADDSSFKLARPICDGFANKDPILLMPWRGTDIPVDDYAAAWGVPLPKAKDQDEEPSVPASTTGGKSSTRRKKITSAASQLKAKETREAKKQAARAALQASLPPSDMRIEGLKQHGLASFDTLTEKKS
jgi:hypothetical protein